MGPTSNLLNVCDSRGGALVPLTSAPGDSAPARIGRANIEGETGSERFSDRLKSEDDAMLATC